MFAKRALLAGVCALALGACATTSPVPQLASSDVPMAFEQPVAAAAPIWPKPDWWRGFGSDELDGLITSAQSGNLDLAHGVDFRQPARFKNRLGGLRSRNGHEFSILLCAECAPQLIYLPRVTVFHERREAATVSRWTAAHDNFRIIPH